MSSGPLGGEGTFDVHVLAQRGQWGRDLPAQWGFTLSGKGDDGRMKLGVGKVGI